MAIYDRSRSRNTAFYESFQIGPITWAEWEELVSEGGVQDVHLQDHVQQLACLLQVCHVPPHAPERDSILNFFDECLQLALLSVAITKALWKNVKGWRKVTRVISYDQRIHHQLQSHFVSSSFRNWSPLIWSWSAKISEPRYGGVVSLPISQSSMILARLLYQPGWAQKNRATPAHTLDVTGTHPSEVCIFLKTSE